MVIYDENGKTIENPDLSKGYVIEHSIPVWHIWLGDRWGDTVDEDGGIVPYGDVTIPIKSENNPDGTDPSEFDNRVPDQWLYGVYTLYTPEELTEIAEQEKQAQAAANMPQRVSELESGVNDAFEATAELGVEVADHAITLDDIMNAIAELGVEMEALNG